MADGGGDNYLTCDETDSDDDSKELRENSDIDETDSEDVSKELREDDDAENLPGSDEEGEQEEGEEFQPEDEEEELIDEKEEEELIDEKEEEELIDEKEEEQFAEEFETLNIGERPGETGEDDVSEGMRLVRKSFYGQGKNTEFVNILTDFAEAEIFLIDGDSLLLEILGEKSLDWNNGGQFLHLTYLTERFLQKFTEKGGVFQIVFLKEMELIWRSNPSMLLAREVLILHLQRNTDFIVNTSMVNFWGKEWKDYVNDKVPAFLLLTDAENIPWNHEKLKEAMEYFFRCLLFHCLAHGLNCVFISGIQTTATKVMGFNINSAPIHKKYFRKFEQPISKAWQFLMSYCQDQAHESSPRWSDTFPEDALVDEPKINVEAEVRKALQPPLRQSGCRQVTAVLGCALILSKALKDSRNTNKTMKTAGERMKLFLLHIILLNKLPLQFRAHHIDKNLLNKFCTAKDDNIFPFNEIHTCLWEILKTVQEVQGDASRDQTGNDFFKSVADLMDGRMVHTLSSVVLQQRSKGVEGLNLPGDVIKEVEDAWKNVVDVVNRSCGSHSLAPEFFPFADDLADFNAAVGSVVHSDADSTMKLRRLTEVQCDLVNDYAGDIRTAINVMAEETSDDEITNGGRKFIERYHWHSLKPLSDDYDRTKIDKSPDDDHQRKRNLRNEQK